MNRLLLSAAGLAVVFSAAVPEMALAQNTRRHVVRTEPAPPLTVNRRSWLEPGNVVAVGTDNTYLSSNTTLHTPIYASYLPARFGQSTLPGQFDLPFPSNPRGAATGGIFFDN